MGIKFGNLSPEEFARLVDAEFTEEELTTLNKHWSQPTKLTDPEHFHIYKDPLCIHVGAVDNEAMKIFAAANKRKTFTRQVPGFLDEPETEAQA